MNTLNDNARLLQLETLTAVAERLALTDDLKVAFQGGTCLHMCHRSPRFSEDLDFLAAGPLAKLEKLMADVAGVVSARMLARGLRSTRLVGRGGKLNVDGVPHNPRLYQLVMPSDRPDLPATRVKVEFMGVPEPLLARYKTQMRMPILEGLRASVSAELPTGSLESIEADKVVALAMRKHPKARDVFDLGWIGHQRAGEQRSLAALDASRGMYEDTPPVGALLLLARERLEAFTPEGMAEELKEYLPKRLAPDYAESLKNEARDSLNRYQRLLERRMESSHDLRP
jgi:hypothetical protein